MSASQQDHRRLKYAVEGCFNGVWGDEPDGKDDLVIVRVADFNRERASVELGDAPTVRAVPLSARNRRVLRRGDLLLEKSGGGEQQPVGNVVLFDVDVAAVCSNFVARMPVASDCDPRFVAYVFQSLYAGARNIPHIKQTSGIQNLDSESYLNEVVWLPPKPRQEAVANFLDEKTARIDALIAEKERLVARLAELRYSTVSWAVTGGLHSARGTFKTGHAFVPELPHGWQFGGLTKYIGPVVDYRGKTPEKVQEGVLLVTARNIRDGVLDYSASAEYVRHDAYEEVMRRGRPAIGDVLFTTEAPLGQVASVDRDDIALAQRVVKFRGLAGVLNNYFLKYWLMGDAVQSTLTTLATGSTAEGIKASKLGQIPLALPSPEEQAEIVAFLDDRRAAIDSASEHVAEHIDRLREYRSSLISAAVTGQLDVGNYKEAA